ncbi:ATP-binding protein [Filomicrobium sp.]|uniref:AAA family ATPase n=1 Tax=Filomicrobium sp. TaxID=2024831 RepID=UPI002590D43B|nr:ATP-binding protein [Filomicrobium sp.]MCV0368274.1 AAA family ATPase [Filomicrobium sp.]
MFFKRERKDKLKVVEAATPPSAPPPAPQERSEQRSQIASVHRLPAIRPATASAADLRRTTNPQTLGFKTTTELEPPVGLLGQDQALQAIAIGASIKTRGHNIVVTGAESLADVAAIRAQIQTIAAKRPPPSDWVYVANFADGQAPTALQLPAGLGSVLATSVNDAMSEMGSAILSALRGDSYQARWRAIDAEFQARHQAGLEALARTADSHSIALLRTPMGYAVAPAHDGSVVLQETFSNMPPTMQADVRAHITALEADLAELLEKAPQIDRQRRARLTKLNREVIASIVRAALSEPRELFAEHPEVLEFFSGVEADVVANANHFLPTIDLTDILDADLSNSIDEARLDRYRVNVFVSWASDANAAPVVQEPAPNATSLFGSEIASGTLAPHMLLVPGALHYANGGFLLLDARALTASGQAWPGLLAALQAGAVCSALAGDGSSSSTLAPAIPLDVKVVLLSDAEHLAQILSVDPRFAELFNVRVAFADVVERTPETERAMARTIAGLIGREAVEPLEPGAVAELIELSSRNARDAGLLSLCVRDFASILHHANARRAAASRKLISRDDIVEARAAQGSSSGSARKTASFPEPAAIGSVVGLKSDGAGPRLQRVSARVLPAFARADTLDVKVLTGVSGTREAGKVIAYLASEFGHRHRIALSALIDGESASCEEESCAELVAVLAAIGEWTLSSSIAIAGTFDPSGHVRPTGDVSTAIEEFFDVCRAAGFNSDAGVVIPKANLSGLMLRKDIVDAVEAGTFAVWPAATVTECVATITGLSAGYRETDGGFAEGDAYRHIDDQLQQLNQRTKSQFAVPPVETEPRP